MLQKLYKNILEQQNIIEGMDWAERQKKPDVLNITFNYKLHEKIFNQVWKWAGKQRITDKNIGFHWQQIPIKDESDLSVASYPIGRNGWGMLKIISDQITK